MIPEDLFATDTENDADSPYKSFLSRYGQLLSIALFGLLLIGLGMFLYKDGYLGVSDKVEVLESSEASEDNRKDLVVEAAGAVEKAGVYKLPYGARIEDLLITAGGVAADADRDWMEKMLNRAARLSDGQKVYIPSVNEQTAVLSAKNSQIYQTIPSTQISQTLKIVNINTADEQTLESLWGIGRVTAQKIIEQRPYSSVEELLTKNIIKQNVYDRNKDILTVY